MHSDEEKHSIKIAALDDLSMTNFPFELIYTAISSKVSDIGVQRKNPSFF